MVAYPIWRYFLQYRIKETPGEEQQHLFPPLFSYLSYLTFPAQDDEHCWQSESGSGNCTLFCLASRTGHCMAATLHSLISGKPGTGPRMVIPFG